VFKAKPSLMAKFLLVAVGAMLLVSAVDAAEKDKIAARLKSPGDVCVFGDECAKGMKVPGAASGPQKPEQVYEGHCKACHGTGANNAPLFSNADAWKPHIAKGINTLYESALNGFNKGAMPPRGTCTECTDDEVKATVDYLVAAAKKK